MTHRNCPGTSSIVDEKTYEPLLSNLTIIVETAVRLRKNGHKVIIVSSGAIGVGLRRMDVEKRPKHLAQQQVWPLLLRPRHVRAVLLTVRHLCRPWRRSANAD